MAKIRIIFMNFKGNKFTNNLDSASCNLSKISKLNA